MVASTKKSDASTCRCTWVSGSRASINTLTNLGAGQPDRAGTERKGVFYAKSN
jgi:hypothetical protein